MTAPLPSKKDTLVDYLAQGVAMLHLDARRPGVQVPERHLGDPHLRLNLSYRYAIPDLTFREDHLQATLSFGGVPFCCIVPWDAIFLITNQTTGEGQVWPDDLPTEIVQALAVREEAPQAPGVAAKGPAARRREASPAPRRPKLQAVERADTDADGPTPEGPVRPAAAAEQPVAPAGPDAAPARPAAAPGPSRSHLRLVR